MSLRTGKPIRRYTWIGIPMTQEVIDRVIYFGENENIPEGVIIRDINGNIEHNDFECDVIKGLHNYNIVENLRVNNHENEDDTNITNSILSDIQNNDDNDDVTELPPKTTRHREELERILNEECVECDLESSIESIQNNFNNELNDFNNINDQIDEIIQ